jgi:LacI family transcriptional regulator
VIVADVANPFFAAAFKGIEAVARRTPAPGGESIHLFLCNTEESIDRLLEVLAELSGRVDGLVIAPPTDTPPPEDLVRRRVPVVLLDREFSGEPFADSVVVDNEGGMAATVQHLAALGHERIGKIRGPVNTTPGRGRYEGYRQGLSASGVPWREELVVVGDFKKASGRAGAAQLLALSPGPTALVAANNLMALGALQELMARRLRIPDDISFASFDDLEDAPLLRPSVSTVSRPMEDQGARAMELLLARLGGDERPPDRVVLPTQFVPRESTGSPPGGDA